MVLKTFIRKDRGDLEEIWVVMTLILPAWILVVILVNTKEILLRIMMWLIKHLGWKVQRSSLIQLLRRFFFQLYMVFLNNIEFNEALQTYSIQKGVNIKLKPNEKESVWAHCKKISCPR